jgi:hypothetical protein
MDQTAIPVAVGVQPGHVSDVPHILLKRTKRLAHAVLFVTVISMLFGNIGVVSIITLVVSVLGIKVGVGHSFFLQRRYNGWARINLA